MKPVEADGPGKPVRVPSVRCTVGGSAFTDSSTLTFVSGDVRQDFSDVSGCSFGRAYVLSDDGTRQMEISKAELRDGRVIVTPSQGSYFNMQSSVELSLSTAEAQQRMVVEFWPLSNGIPITYDYPRDRSDLGMSITGNDFSLVPDNVQFYAKDSTRANTYCADARIELARGWALSFVSPDVDASVTAEIVEDLSEGEQNLAGNFTTLRTVRLYHFCYTNPHAPKAGTVTVNVTPVSDVSYRVATLPGERPMDKWGQTGAREEVVPSVNNQKEAYEYRYGWMYTIGIGTYNTSKMVNPFVYKVNVPTQSENSKALITDRSNIPGMESQTMRDSFVPERVDGISSLVSGRDVLRVDQSSNAFDFYVQSNGLPYQLINPFTNGQDASHDQTVAWSYFLDRVSINGQWMPVPLPKIYRLNPPLTYNRENDQQYYREVRNETLKGIDVLPYSQIAGSNGAREWYMCSINNGLKDYQGTTVGDAAGVHVYSPDNGRTPFFAHTFDSGPLAGARVEVSLINIRSVQDGRSYGFHRSDDSASEFWGQQRDFQGNSIGWKWNGGFWGQNEANNTLGVNSGPAPSIAPAVQMTDISPCSDFPIFTGSDQNNRLRDFRQFNTWKTMYRIRVINPPTENLDVQARFDPSVNGGVWNAGSTGIEFTDESGTSWPTFGSSLRTSDTGAFADRPVCGADGLPSGCATALKKWMPGQANDGTKPVFKFRLKDGYGEPIVRVQNGFASGGGVAGANGLVDLTPTAAPDTSASEWAKNGENSNGEFTFSFTDNRNPSFCWSDAGATNNEQGWVTSCNTRAVGYSGQYGASVLAKIISVPVNYRDTNGTLIEGLGLINGQKVNRVYANRYLVQGPIPILSGVAANSWKLMGVKTADHPEGAGTVEIAKGLLPGQQIDITTIGDSNGIQLVNTSTGKAAFSELYLVPDTEEDSDFDTTGHLVYPVTTHVGESLPGTLHDTVGTYIAVPGLTVRYVGEPEVSVTHDGANYYYNQVDSSLTVAPLTGETSSSLKLLYSPRPSTVVVTKKWNVNGTEYVNGFQPPQLRASYTADGASADWGFPIPSNSGTTLALTETTSRVSGFERCMVTGVSVESTSSETFTPTVTHDADSDTWMASVDLPGYSESSDNVRVVDEVNVRYQYMTADPTYVLPDSIADLAPSPTTAVYGTVVSAPVPQTLVVPEEGNTGYTWHFSGWDSQVKRAYGDTTFIGRWTRIKDTDKEKTVGYLWAWAGNDSGALPGTGLPSLPAVWTVASTYTLAPYPAGVHEGQVLATELGNVTVSGSSEVTGTGLRQLTLTKAQSHAVTYDVEFDFSTLTGSPGYVAAVKNFFTTNPTPRSRAASSLPDAKTVVEGQSFTPDAMKNFVISLDGDYGDWGGANNLTLVFNDWKHDDTHPLKRAMGSGDEMYTAIFSVYRSGVGGGVNYKHRGILYENRSATNQYGSESPITIPSDVNESMQKIFSAKREYYSVLWAGTGTTWTVPSLLVGESVPDALNRGTWTLTGFKRVQPTDGAEVDVTPGTQITVNSGGSATTTALKDEFPRVWDSLKNSWDDRNWVETAGGDRNLHMIALWEFKQAPTYTVTNTVTCNTAVRFHKEIGEIADAVPGVETAPNPASWAVRMSHPNVSEDGKAYWEWTGNLEIPGTWNVTQRQNILNSTDYLNLSENTDRAGLSPQPLYVPSAYTCASGTPENVNLDEGTATVRFGLGQNVDCTVVNVSSQLTLLGALRVGEDTVAATGFTPTMTATPPADPDDGAKTLPEGLSTVTVNSATASAVADTTGMVRPRSAYTLSATSNSAYVLVGFEKYTGKTPNDESILGSTSWEALAATEGASVDPGTHAVYRAIFAPLPAPVLPLTGGLNSKIAYVLAGLGALGLSVLSAWALKRRRESGLARD